MASLALQSSLIDASSELRSAVERFQLLKQETSSARKGTDEDLATDEDLEKAQSEVNAKQAALQAAVKKLSLAQDSLEKKNPAEVAAAKLKTPVEKIVSPGQSQMVVDSSQYHSIKVVPKTDEINDGNFPPSLLAAMELFGKVKMIQQGRELQTSVETFCRLLESGPPVEAVSMGVASVCWECGHVGLPVNVADVTKLAPAKATKEELSKLEITATCSRCSGNVQTNLVRVTQPDGSMVPWIEAKSEQKKKAEDARAKMEKKDAKPDVVVGEGSDSGSGRSSDGKKIKPNERCPCGSGKKYKKCCK